MKIILISGNPYHEDYGGVDVHTTNLIKELLKNKEIQLVHITFDKKPDKKENDYQEIILKTIPNPLQVIRYHSLAAKSDILPQD